MKAKNRDHEILIGLLSLPEIPVLSITWKLGETEEARREIREYIESWPTPNTNLHLLVKGLLELANLFNRSEVFWEFSPQPDGWGNVLSRYVPVPFGIESGTTLFQMSNNAVNNPPRQMGYFNHHPYPVCAMMGNRKLDLESGEPVLNHNGEPIASHPDLDVLVRSGLLKTIPLNDEKWVDVFNKTRRLSSTRVATPTENDQRAKTIATNMGLNRNANQAELPEGAEYITEGASTYIKYKGRKYTSMQALLTMINSENPQ